jgi:hypothetical protein|tara:strand:+ start:708 stop:917 length:210 start_codon:yes stop_codon:yes gene_type:complete
MEIIDFKERLQRTQKGSRVVFTPEEKTFLFGTYFNLTGKIAKSSCGSCHNYTYKILLNYINILQNEKRG